jgi:hypothetical protein
MGWLGDAAGELVLNYRGQRLPVKRISAGDVADRFGFVRTPVK